MQYRIGEKLRPGELEFTLSNVKQEMANSIEYEIKRKNVDTAKKLACKQLVNYDQFEELVRGANLKTVKTNEMSDLFTDAVSSTHNLSLKMCRRDSELWGKFFVRHKIRGPAGYTRCRCRQREFREKTKKSERGNPDRYCTEF
jgi:hypothetical protein